MLLKIADGWNINRVFKKNAFVNVPNLLRNEMSLVIQYVDNV